MINQLKYFNKFVSLLDLINQLKFIITRIDGIKYNTQLSYDEKREILKKIRTQINVISQQVDAIKKEIKLISTYKVN
jgi:3-deoxy-D-manno-octulosonate 8-phosphate phosphatase KdsC-like HAD superfamily phosphatase